MKKANFKFVGYENKCYCFIDSQGKTHLFVKCRKDLIEEYHLNDTVNQDQWFQIDFFQTQSNNRIDDLDNSINIISDMKIINV